MTRRSLAYTEPNKANFHKELLIGLILFFVFFLEEMRVYCRYREDAGNQELSTSSEAEVSDELWAL